MLRYHGQRKAATGHEFSLDTNAPRFARGHKIIENSVHHRLVKRSDVAIGREIKLERFRLYALLVRDVLNTDLGKIRLTRYRTQRRKLRRIDSNPKSRFGQGFGNVSILASCGEAGKVACEFPSSVNPAYFRVRDFFISTAVAWHVFATGENSKAAGKKMGSPTGTYLDGIAYRISRQRMECARLAAAMEGFSRG